MADEQSWRKACTVAHDAAKVPLAHALEPCIMELVPAGSLPERDAGGNEPDGGGLSLSRHSKDHTTCRWTIAPFSKVG